MGERLGFVGDALVMGGWERLRGNREVKDKELGCALGNVVFWKKSKEAKELCWVYYGLKVELEKEEFGSVQVNRTERSRAVRNLVANIQKLQSVLIYTHKNMSLNPVKTMFFFLSGGRGTAF